MEKISKFSILASFFALWLVSYLSTNSQIILGFLMIFSFGILHGANDLMLILNLKRREKSISFVKILIYYILLVFFGIISFYFYPFLALLFFVIISCYHFGEQQFQIFEKYVVNWLCKILQIIYGSFIFIIIFNFHLLEVQKIIFEISKTFIPIIYFETALKIIISILIVLFLYLYIYVKKLRNQVLLEVFYLLVLTIIFMVSSLIWGFAIYFIIWHSIPSILDQMKFLYGNNELSNFKQYFKSAFWYWIFSLLGIMILYLIFEDQKIFNALFFSFLAAITFPHVLVIINMFRTKN